MRRGTSTKVAKELKAASTKYPYIGSMVKDLDEMVDTLRNWSSQEEDATAEGRSNYSYSRYYAHLADVIEMTAVTARRIAKSVE